ncbi:XkdX family protein [Bacillus sp. WMMC1349]|nr:XkdX family protein [Bacillus sp. WMMC1349]
MISQVLSDGNSTPPYELFCDCWENGTVTTIQLKKALSTGLITQSDYDQITASPRGGAIPDETGE